MATLLICHHHYWSVPTNHACQARSEVAPKPQLDSTVLIDLQQPDQSLGLPVSRVLAVTVSDHHWLHFTASRSYFSHLCLVAEPFGMRILLP